MHYTQYIIEKTLLNSLFETFSLKKIVIFLFERFEYFILLFTIKILLHTKIKFFKGSKKIKNFSNIKDNLKN